MIKTSYKSSNPVPEILLKEIESQLKNAPVERQMLDRMYDFKVIELPLGYPYYNLENVRTTTACEEYAKKNNLPPDYFSSKNFWLKKAQDHYHQIIFNQLDETGASERYKKIFQENEATQTDKLFLTPDGILINGNSRTSWWRETKPKNIGKVKYYVFDKGYTFEEMTKAILVADEDVDITESYPWFELAKNARTELNQLNSPSKNDLTNIADKYRYGNIPALNQAIDKLELAEDFLQRGYKGFDYFSDLSELGAEKGTQVFSTLEAGIRNSRSDQYKTLDDSDREQIKSDCFFLIADQVKSFDEETSAHLAVQKRWKKEALQEIIKNKSTKVSPSTDVLKRNNKKTSSKQQIKKPTLKEVKKRQAAVGTAITISRSQQKKLALKELIEKVSGQVSSWDKMLNSNTDIPKTKKAFTKLESELKSFSKKLNQL